MQLFPMGKAAVKLLGEEQAELLQVAMLYSFAHSTPGQRVETLRTLRVRLLARGHVVRAEYEKSAARAPTVEEVPDYFGELTRLAAMVHDLQRVEAALAKLESATLGGDPQLRDVFEATARTSEPTS